MNNERRKQIRRLEDLLEKQIQSTAATLADMLVEARDLAEEIRDGEQDSFDALPESLQNGDKGDVMQDAMSSLGEVFDILETFESNVREIADGIDGMISSTDNAKGSE